MGKSFIVLTFLLPFMVNCSAENSSKSTQTSRQSNNALLADSTNRHTPPQWNSPELPAQITFAGETIELDDLDLKERLDYELIINNYWHSNTIITLKLANRWLPMMKEIIRQEGLPEDLVYIAVIESGLRNVVSPAGAKGFWQFMESAGKEYGLIINQEVDERYHIEKSTKAACQYLKKAYAKFNSWPLAAAAYNRGMNGIQRDLEGQGVRSFYDLSLNAETARYVFRLFAIKLIFENPENYGFVLKKDDLYPPYETKDVKVHDPIPSIYDWAIQQGVNTKIVRKLNPWIIGQELNPNKEQPWIVKLPKNDEQLRMINR